MMKEDGYRWKDDVELIKNEDSIWYSKNITEKLKKMMIFECYGLDVDVELMKMMNIVMIKRILVEIWR